MKKFKKITILILIILVSGFVVIYGFTYAKFISDSVWNYYLKSKGFYFSSDYLSSSDVVKNVNNLWDGNSVHFNIKNNLNQTVITDYDIGYSAVCTITGEAASHAECHMNGSASNTQDGILSSLQSCINNTTDEVDVTSLNKTNCELGGYDWLNQVVTKDLYFDIVLTDTNYVLTDVVVNITVNSTAPYSDTLSGDFTLHKSSSEEENVTLNYKNYSTYDRLVITNSYPSTKCVKVSWDADKLMINADASQYSSAVSDLNGYINEINFNINAKESLSYIFYSKDFESNYNVSEFLVEETEGCE